MKMNKRYLFAFLILLAIEIIIALFIHDAVIRPYLGDILVVILMYNLIRGMVKKIKYLPVYLFLFATVIEISQYFQLVYRLQLQDYKIISTILGTSFDVKDIFCYLIATVILMIWERLVLKWDTGRGSA